MHVDFDALGQKLGRTPDALRIEANIPTRLQKLMRKAQIFEEIAPYAAHFRKPEFGSCGPKYEPEELAEYRSLREKLFPSYLSKFETIESFEHFGFVTLGFSLTTESEDEQASRKLSELYELQIAETLALPEGKLERLSAIRAELKARDDERRYNEYSRQLSIRSALTVATKTVRDTFFAEFVAAKTLTEKLAVFRKLGSMPQYDLSGSSLSYPWHSLWEDAAKIGDIMRIEKSLNSQFLDTEAIEEKFTALVGTALLRIEGFDHRMKFAARFKQRDSHGPSRAYTKALCGVAEVAGNSAEIHAVLEAWSKRTNHNSSSDAWRDLTLPQEIVIAYDHFHLVQAETENDPKALVAIWKSAPHGTRTQECASDRISTHFKARMADAETPEEVDAIKTEADSIGWDYMYVSARDRKSEIAEAERARRTDLLWQAIERGEEIEEKALIGLYHSFEEESERRRIVLGLLFKHSPAEEFDEVEVMK